MPQISHEFAIGRVRALESTLLKQDVIEKLLTAQDAQDAFRMLAEAGWGEISSRAELEQAAENRQKEACAFLKECSADPVLTDLFLLQYDMLNLKILLKAQMLGKEVQQLSHNGSTDPETLRVAIENHDLSRLSAECVQTVQAIREKCADGGSPAWVDFLLDQFCFRLIAERLEKSHRCPQALREYFACQADFTNARMALRMQKLGLEGEYLRAAVPGGKVAPGEILSAWPYPMDLTGDIASLEREMDDYLLQLIKNHRYDVDNVMPLVGFYLARMREISAVRLIVTGKAVGAAEEGIRSRLRATYA